MKYLFKPVIYALLLSTILLSCGSASGVLSTPIENIDTAPIKESKLTETEINGWSHLDLLKDTIPGMSVDKAYNKIIKGKKGKTVIVAVIDSGIDIDHEDLDGVIWTNEDEIPNNGKDDDNNGYVDDIHGWNFVGDGYNEQLEFVRLLASGDKSNPRYAEAEAEYNTEYQKFTGYKTQYDQILQQVTTADNMVSKHLNNKAYTLKDVKTIQTQDEALAQSVAIIKYVYSLEVESVPSFLEEIRNGLVEINERLNFNLNKNLKGRKTGDNPDDLNDKPGYGNNNPRPSKQTEDHGTHVTGIIAAERNNDIGMNGVANNVKVMAIRSTPNGDEYDKDVALAIRYAADNGAKVINASFGKSYSPNSEWVYDAIKYAADKDVLFVHAAGNDSKNIDITKNFPNDAIGTGPEIADNFITVGSLTYDYGSNMVSSFSNYGQVNVDVFAPGSDVYSTMPENKYDLNSGTSMAAPNVAGVAALIRSQYPNLTAAQTKKILMDSGLPIKAKVTIGKNKEVKTLSEISKSGRIVNAYNALILASQITNSK
ncbi:Subtilase family protein [Formosa sp. Hel1_31_208]|uniref:S8 family peptidase n=1 Tax=Formosa sp. Hel1_31_208 TaxID=1798225 RepID=UPI00087CCA28|nr:S8 family peptidase [Formosa sp. Hel1_31_208]SDR73565.1 Subtilase family protein [Formosa sp. Hel1_31_208]